MLIPNVRRTDLDIPNAGVTKTPCEKTAMAKVGRFRTVHPIELSRAGGLSRDINELGSHSLHTKRHLITADHTFHLLVYEACGNDLLKDILEGLRYKALPLAFKLSPHFTDFYNYHQQIVTAFENKDGAAAEAAMRQHNRRMLELVKTTPWGVENDTISN